MNLLDKTRFVERPQFFDGQTLFADDMQTVEAFNREMRWLHNRLLHRTGAIGNGYAVQGNKGDRVVTIGPGLALDHEGREIVLLEDLSEPVPPISGDEEGGPAYFDLTVSYPHDDQLEATETRIGFCGTAGAVRLREKPIVTWVRLKKTAAGSMEVKNGEQRAAIKRGELVVIARASVLDCQLNDVLSLQQRRSARPSCRPYIAAGTEKMPQWRLWLGIERDELIDLLVQAVLNNDSDDGGSGGSDPGVFALISEPEGALRPGIETRVDTSSAAFATTPHYSARLEGSRLIPMPQLNEESDNQPAYIFVNANLFIDEPNRQHFVARIMIDSVDNDLSLPPPSEFISSLLNSDSSAFSTSSDSSESLADLETAYLKLQACIAAAAGNEETLYVCFETFLTKIDELLLPLLIPENWQIAWMGVEG